MVNAEGPWVVGGLARNAGHTGRKQATDTYGGAARQGDGALSGKDPTRLDRSAAYAARHAATNVVAAGLADRVRADALLRDWAGRADDRLRAHVRPGPLPDEQLSRDHPRGLRLATRAHRPAVPALDAAARAWRAVSTASSRWAARSAAPTWTCPGRPLDAIDALRDAAGAGVTGGEA